MNNASLPKQAEIGFKFENPFYEDNLVCRGKKLCYHTGSGRTKNPITGDKYEIQRKIDKDGNCSHGIQLFKAAVGC